MMNEQILTIMTKNPVSLHENAKLSDVHDLFEHNRIHHIPIHNEEGHLCGLVTTYDLWKLNKPFEAYQDMQVKDIMTRKIARLSPQDKVGTAAELFLDNRFHALPVVEDEKLVGIVTSFDVLRYSFKKEYEKPILFKEVLEDGISVQ